MLRYSKWMGYAVLVKEEYIPASSHRFAGNFLPTSNGIPPCRVFHHPAQVYQTWFYPNSQMTVTDFADPE